MTHPTADKHPHAGRDFVQLLTPEGERVEHPDYSLELSPEQYRGFYRDLLLTRRIDVEATALQRQGELGLWAQCLGQEAAQVGAGRALHADDFAFPTYREHGVAWTRGIEPISLLKLFRGTTLGGWDPEEHNFALYTIVIGAQTLHAVGYAMGMQRDGVMPGADDAARDADEISDATMVFFGDGATSQGDVNESFIWASVFDAPVVFFCQNNQWAISEPLEKQTRIPLYQRASGFGFPGVRVDGNDVLASYAVAKSALERARRGDGPTFVEAFTYRMGAHTTSDDPTRYRLSSDLEEWKLRDPLERMRSYLYKQQFADADFFTALDMEADDLAADLRAQCLALPDPDPLSIFEGPYATDHPLVAEERAQFAEYLASFEGV